MALHEAASNGHKATVRLLLYCGARIEAVSSTEAASYTGSTALYKAAENGHEATVRLLLDRDAPSRPRPPLDGWHRTGPP